MRRLLYSLVFVGLAGCGEGWQQAKDLQTALNDPERYAKQLDGRCERGEAAACTSIGVQTAFGTFGRTKDYDAAIPFLTRGCEGGDPQGCHELGVMHKHGRGVEKDEARAATLFEVGCDAEIANSCHYLGEAYEAGRGVEADEETAAAYFARACAAGSSYSCDR